MFPYPSGKIHMGHVRNYSIGDLIARYKWKTGHEVLHPLGWDSFGLPAENAAIDRGIAPDKWTYSNIETMKIQLKKMGLSIDWTRELATSDESYYRWGQWIFLKMYEKGLVYKKSAPVNWCSKCNTVLANEQVVGDGYCWRHDTTTVDQKNLEQWFFKITDFAEELLDGHNELQNNWPDRVIQMQKHWIGKSHGCSIDFKLEDGRDFPIYTTRPDTIFGVTYMAIAANHPLLENHDIPGLEDLKKQVIKETTDDDRTEPEKFGIDTGLRVQHPFLKKALPVWAANFVLMEYGTGCIMCVPAHDQRDFEFAKKYDLLIQPVIVPEEDYQAGPEKSDLFSPENLKEAFEGEGRMINCGEYNGLTSENFWQKIADRLGEEKLGKREVQYKFRDWLISRQRYWGNPIPIIYCEKCGTVPVPEKDLPVRLPLNLDLHVGQEKSPTQYQTSPEYQAFINVKCPSCSGGAVREKDTMDTFVDSSWYFLRYTSSGYEKKPVNPKASGTWMPVDQYIGGIEHACMHLLYARFFNMVMYDLNLVSCKEPFQRLLTQGMVIKDGAKMSKSKGNIVDPDELLEQYGADTIRLFCLFASPPEKDLDWSDKGVSGVFRFLQRFWRLFGKFNSFYVTQTKRSFDKEYSKFLEKKYYKIDSYYSKVSFELRVLTHKTVKMVTRDIENNYQLNTPIARMMELVNGLYALDDKFKGNAKIREEERYEYNFVISESLDYLINMLYIYAPHICSEAWEMLGENAEHLIKSKWPVYIKDLTLDAEKEWPIQINGKKRSTVMAPQEIKSDELLKLVKKDEKIQNWIQGKKIIKEIVVPNKLVNLVVK
jgi:leucyl-tRNA synthetase